MHIVATARPRKCLPVCAASIHVCSTRDRPIAPTRLIQVIGMIPPLRNAAEFMISGTVFPGAHNEQRLEQPNTLLALPRIEAGGTPQSHVVAMSRDIEGAGTRLAQHNTWYKTSDRPGSGNCSLTPMATFQALPNPILAHQIAMEDHVGYSCLNERRGPTSAPFAVLRAA
jgi:hypothetical protein